ncbi:MULTISPECIES: hypothetical protein [unclassified Microcoleus]
MKHLGGCVGFWGDRMADRAEGVRIAPQARLKRWDMWHGLAV